MLSHIYKLRQMRYLSRSVEVAEFLTFKYEHHVPARFVHDTPDPIALTIRSIEDEQVTATFPVKRHNTDLCHLRGFPTPIFVAVYLSGGARRCRHC